jgi:hypothetical protein
MVTTTGTSIALSGGISGLTRDFSDGYRLGFATGWDVGHAVGVKDEGDAWTSIVTGWAEDWRRPRHDELLARRAVTHEPCVTRCGRCATCVHAEAWERRGGRPFLGVEAEQQRGAA